MATLRVYSRKLCAHKLDGNKQVQIHADMLEGWYESNWGHELQLLQCVPHYIQYVQQREGDQVKPEPGPRFSVPSQEDSYAQRMEHR